MIYERSLIKNASNLMRFLDRQFYYPAGAGAF